jgi:hypothetical protein
MPRRTDGCRQKFRCAAALDARPGTVKSLIHLTIHNQFEPAEGSNIAARRAEDTTTVAVLTARADGSMFAAFDNGGWTAHDAATGTARALDMTSGTARFWEETGYHESDVPYIVLLGHQPAPDFGAFLAPPQVRDIVYDDRPAWELTSSRRRRRRHSTSPSHSRSSPGADRSPGGRRACPHSGFAGEDQAERVPRRVEVHAEALGVGLKLCLPSADREHRSFPDIEVVDIEIDVSLLRMLVPRPHGSDELGDPLEGDRHSPIGGQLHPLRVLATPAHREAGDLAVEPGEGQRRGTIECDEAELGDTSHGSDDIRPSETSETGRSLGQGRAAVLDEA